MASSKKPEWRIVLVTAHNVAWFEPDVRKAFQQAFGGVVCLVVDMSDPDRRFVRDLAGMAPIARWLEHCRAISREDTVSDQQIKDIVLELFYKTIEMERDPDV